MKKFARILVSLVLVIALVASLGVCSFAKDKVVYTCLGDSNAAGYGTTGYTYSRTPAPNAYHTIVANALDAELRDYGCSGFRTFEMRYLLDPDFDIAWDYAQISTEADIDKASIDAYKDAYIQSVIDADYITIQIGENDILGDDIGFAGLEFYTPVQEIEDIKAALGENGSLNETLTAVFDTLTFTVQLVKFATSFYSRIQQSYGEFYENWDAIIKNIYRLNPDVHIIALSAINALNNASIIDGSPIKSCRLLNLVFDKLNGWIESGSEYADTYDYCDVSDLLLGDLAFTSEDFWDTYLVKGHPTDEQHQEIAKRILAILDEGK